MITLEPRRRPRASRRWLWGVVPLVLLVVALCVGLVVQRSGRLEPAAGGNGSAVPAPASVQEASLTLPAAGRAVVQLQTAGSISRVALATGTVTTTATPAPGTATDLLAGQDWVISKAVDGTSGVLIRDGRPPEVLSPVLQQAGRAYPAGTDRIWAVPEQPSGGYRTAVLLDTAGGRVGSTTTWVPAAYGVPVGHLGHTLVVVDDHGSPYEARPQGLRRLSSGALLAIGIDLTLSWDCDAGGACSARLDQPGRASQTLPAVQRAIEGLYPGGAQTTAGTRGILSPDRRWAALALPAPTRSGAQLVVVDLRSGRVTEVAGALAGTDADDQVAWTPNSRYLLALTGHRLHILDTVKDVVVTPAGAPPDLLHLTVPGSTSM